MWYILAVHYCTRTVLYCIAPYRTVLLKGSLLPANRGARIASGAAAQRYGPGFLLQAPGRQHRLVDRVDAAERLRVSQKASRRVRFEAARGRSELRATQEAARRSSRSGTRTVPLRNVPYSTAQYECILFCSVCTTTVLYCTVFCVLEVCVSEVVKFSKRRVL